MTKSLKNLNIAIFILFLLLFSSITYIQFFSAEALRNNINNSRTIYQQNTKQRGPITVANSPIVFSEEVEDSYRFLRVYQDPYLYGHITGYNSNIYGNSGLEKTLNQDLLGENNSSLKLSDIISGRQMSGSSVQLTIDPEIQKTAYEAFGDMRGAAIVMNPKTGEILASISKPSYDPNLLSSHDNNAVSEAWKNLNSDPSFPLYDRTISGNLYAPGSVFKVLVAAAALESGKYDENSVLEGSRAIILPGTDNVELPNYGNRACSSTNRVTLTRALEVSCNTAFAKLGMDLGAESIEKMSEAFGFSKKLDIPLPVTPSVFPNNMGKAQLAQSSIGQYDVKTTPLQLAMMVSAVANKGTIMKPYLVKNIINENLESITTTKPEKLYSPISEKTAATLNKMMISVVYSGTASGAKVPGVTVGGKTGTAEKSPGDPPNALFAGFGTSSDGSEVVLAVVVEDGGNLGLSATGETVATPIAQKIMETVFKK